ncbi:MAG: cob(I)yrinic acid a,c-diamide adenosyltransferase [Parasporobacterium sp.]|nr:cob(I)yrinic acid a,c-diamide adenosyltransferase [Parasporobacterium sp.]
MRGMVHIYCGNGKGKTTTAVGLAVRAAGAGRRVIFAQFLKSGDSSEIGVLGNTEGITVVHCNTIRGFFSVMTPEERMQAAKDYSEMLRQVIEMSRDADMLVLDEAVASCNLGVINEAELCEFLRNRPENMEVVLTGRNPSGNLLALADYVTEMKKHKHPYDEGIPARRGIEF